MPNADEYADRIEQAFPATAALEQLRSEIGGDKTLNAHDRRDLVLRVGMYLDDAQQAGDPPQGALNNV